MALRLGRQTDRSVQSGDTETGFPSRGRRALRIAVLAIGALLFWYAVIGTIRGGIDIDTGLRPSPDLLPAGGSVTVATAASLLRREVEDRSFTPNDPFFYPTGLARRTSAFQAEVVGTVSDVVGAVAQYHAGSDVSEAAEKLTVPPERWWIGSSPPFLGVPAERAYSGAIDDLIAWNRTRTSGIAAPGPHLSPESRLAIQKLVDRIDTRIAEGDQLIRGAHGGSMGLQLSRSRGTAFASALLLRGLRDDNSVAVRASDRAAQWGEALDSLERAAAVSPAFPRASDLVTIGYSLLIARNAMHAVLEGGR